MDISNRNSHCFFVAHPFKACHASCAASLWSAANYSLNQWGLQGSYLQALSSFSSSARALNSFSLVLGAELLALVQPAPAVRPQALDEDAPPRLAQQPLPAMPHVQGRALRAEAQPPAADQARQTPSRYHGWKAVRRQETLQPKGYGKQSEGWSWGSPMNS